MLSSSARARASGSESCLARPWRDGAVQQSRQGGAGHTPRSPVPGAARAVPSAARKVPGLLQASGQHLRFPQGGPAERLIVYPFHPWPLIACASSGTARRCARPGYTPRPRPQLSTGNIHRSGRFATEGQARSSREGRAADRLGTGTADRASTRYTLRCGARVSVFGNSSFTEDSALGERPELGMAYESRPRRPAAGRPVPKRACRAWERLYGLPEAVCSDIVALVTVGCAEVLVCQRCRTTPAGRGERQGALAGGNGAWAAPPGGGMDGKKSETRPSRRAWRASARGLGPGGGRPGYASRAPDRVALSAGRGGDR